MRARDVLGSEWTKVRSVRSTYWILLIAAVTAIGGSTIIAAAATGRAGHSPFEPLEPVFIAWVEYPVLAVGILGVLAFTAEYSTGQIRTTFAAVPQRRAVLAAKAGAVGLLTLCFSELLAFISFFLSQAIVSNHRGLSLAHPGMRPRPISCVRASRSRDRHGRRRLLGAIIRHTAARSPPSPRHLCLSLVCCPYRLLGGQDRQVHV